MAAFLLSPPARFQPTLPLSDRLAKVHLSIRAFAPSVHRVAFALYQPASDLLSPYVSNSHQLSEPSNVLMETSRLSDSASLRYLSETHQSRVIDDMTLEPWSDSPTTTWLMTQRFRSSYTVPLYWGDDLLGFLFFNSRVPDVFGEEIIERLAPHVELITILIGQDVAVINSLKTAVRLALNGHGLRDEETATHQERVSLYSRLIAMGIATTHALHPDFMADLYLFAGLHDIGKVAIEPGILHKQGPLTPEERQTMKRHVNHGLTLLEQFTSGLSQAKEPKFRILHNVVAYHHERLNGSGYPFGLSGEAIPIEARIVAVADIYDALTQVRPYKGAFSESEAIAMMLEMAERGEIDPDCLQVLISSEEARHAISTLFRD